MASKKDTFVLYDLKVETLEGSRPFVCSHRAGDSFLVVGENLVFPEGGSFSMYSLSALLPLLPAKQRPTDPNDWMTTDAEIACPDPNCGALFRVTRVGRRTFSHAEATAVPLQRPAAKESGGDSHP
ncbi:MAG: TIGR04076 family protein [Spirochaetales bacterium]|nr:TIGR04076 family protein [Spirochaetales bacterium]